MKMGVSIYLSLFLSFCLLSISKLKWDVRVGDVKNLIANQISRNRTVERFGATLLSLIAVINQIYNTK